ncbi:hypothetical protein HELRODRAFT_161710 [Helobdella robusta]|uniref:SRCR domain-containing protein n=1 Tax=Helobdella robusta TaxID=6412 RepID=T1ERT5_HELRO|nr:hypothetical protein HELRODRAFT_161710 [Helobdella robusta]ESO02439.1 hypothetical protein HELRODRAFT_161710 [Helobdella robusta]
MTLNLPLAMTLILHLMAYAVQSVTCKNNLPANENNNNETNLATMNVSNSISSDNYLNYIGNKSCGQNEVYVKSYNNNKHNVNNDVNNDVNNNDINISSSSNNNNNNISNINNIINNNINNNVRRDTDSLEKPIMLRLVNSDSKNLKSYGYLEIFKAYKKEWYSICGINWTDVNTKLACQSLGFNGGMIVGNMIRFTGYRNKYTDDVSIVCEPTDKSFEDCYTRMLPNKNYNEKTLQPVYLHCFPVNFGRGWLRLGDVIDDNHPDFNWSGGSQNDYDRDVIFKIAYAQLNDSMVNNATMKISANDWDATKSDVLCRQNHHLLGVFKVYKLKIGTELMAEFSCDFIFKLGRVPKDLFRCKVSYRYTDSFVAISCYNDYKHQVDHAGRDVLIQQTNTDFMNITMMFRKPISRILLNRMDNINSDCERMAIVGSVPNRLKCVLKLRRKLKQKNINDTRPPKNILNRDSVDEFDDKANVVDNENKE